MIIFLSPYFACNVYIYTYTHTHIYVCVCRALPGGSVVKNPPANAGDVGSIPGSGRSSRGNGNPLQYSCLENSMDRGAWCATVHGSQRVGHDFMTNMHTSVVKS